jgi:hypothetical protein
MALGCQPLFEPRETSLIVEPATLCVAAATIVRVRVHGGEPGSVRPLRENLRSEDHTPIEERYLWFEGKVSPRAMAAVRRLEAPTRPALPATSPPDSEFFFVGFSYADLPVGKEFDVVYPKGKPERGELCRSEIVAVTQQFSKPMSEVPHGWKTICLVRFPAGIPSIVRDLPVVDGWYQHEDCVCVCSRLTWEHLTARQPA